MNGKFRRLKRYELFWPVNSAAGITWEGYADDADDALVGYARSSQALRAIGGKNPWQPYPSGEGHFSPSQHAVSGGEGAMKTQALKNRREPFGAGTALAMLIAAAVFVAVWWLASWK